MPWQRTSSGFTPLQEARASLAGHLSWWSWPKTLPGSRSAKEVAKVPSPPVPVDQLAPSPRRTACRIPCPSQDAKGSGHQPPPEGPVGLTPRPGAEVTKVEQDRSRRRASRPLRNGSLATPNHSPDGEVIRVEAARIAAPHLPAVDETDARKASARLPSSSRLGSNACLWVSRPATS